MGKIIFCVIIAGVCFGEDEGQKYDSKFAIGVTDGLNYAIYIGDEWAEKTASAPRINIGIDSKFSLSFKFSNEWELSYLRLFYNTKHNYWDTVFVYEDRITFDNIYFSSRIEVAILRRGYLTPNIGIGFACVWPFTGTWDSYSFSYKNANNCRALFLTSKVGLNIDKYPFENTLLNFAFHTHYCIASTFDPYIHHPFVWTKGVAISESIPLRFTLALLFKL